MTNPILEAGARAQFKRRYDSRSVQFGMLDDAMKQMMYDDAKAVYLAMTAAISDEQVADVMPIVADPDLKIHTWWYENVNDVRTALAALVREEPNDETD